jgi:hypothetical protein
MLVLIDLEELLSYKQNMFRNRTVSIRLLMVMLISGRTTDSNVVVTSIRVSSQSRVKIGQTNKAPLFAMYIALRIVFVIRAYKN